MTVHTLCDMARPLAEVTSVSYVAEKDGHVEIYRHEFSRFRCPTEGRTRYPYLLVADPSGSRKIKPIAKAAKTLGRVIDFESKTGRILVGGFWVVTHGNGQYMWLSSDKPLLYGFETHPKGPKVKPEGIVD